MIRTRIRGILVSVFWLLFLLWLDYQGWFSYWDGRIFNKILSAHSTGPESPASKEIYVVEIDDDAYKTCFDQQSPMYSRVVFSLVEAVAAANPKVIGVDIRTEGDVYRNWIGELKQYASSIVWVSDIDRQISRVAPFQNWLLGERDNTTVTPLPVLGTQPVFLPKSPQTNWGVPLYPLDEDLKLRRFPRTVTLAATDVQGGGSAPSWASRVADVYCQPECTAESADEVYISYAGVEPHRYKMLDLFTCSSGPQRPKEGPELSVKSAEWPALLGKIVLVGGTFRESRDFYPTPKGQLPGLIVNAYAVKAELNGNGFVELEQPLAWMLDLALGWLILVICDERALRRLDNFKALNFVDGWKRKKIVASTAAVVAFCFASLFFAKGRYLMGFAGEGAGVIVDRMSELWEFSKKEPKDS